MSPSTQDFISVIIPAYNAEKYLEESLESLYNQDVAIPFEIIVVNDGSTDGTLEILQRQLSKIRIINQTNKGIARARNAGFKAAKGNYITGLDADDLCLPHKLSFQWQFLNANPQYDMVFGKVEQFISPELDNGQNVISENIKVLPALTFPGGMFRAAAFKKNGLIDESLNSCGDFMDWFIKAKEKGLPFAIIDEVLQKRRIHNTNYGRLNTSEQVDYLKVLRAKLKRAKNQ